MQILSFIARPTKAYIQQMDRALLSGILFMLASMAWFSVMNVIIRSMTFEMNTLQIVFLRNVCSTLILLPWVAYLGFSMLKTERMKGHVWRSALGVTGMQAWFYAISLMPLNNATALSFLAPILAAVLAIVILREKAGWHRWGAIFMAFIGAMIIIRPDSDVMNWDALIVIFAATFWAAAGILVKSLAKTEPTTRIVFYMSVFMMVMAAPPMFWVWQEPTIEQLVAIFGIALASTGAHVCLVNAYGRADVIMLMPFDFSRLIFTALLTWLVFSETSGWHVWLGAAIILASAIYITHRETVKKSNHHCAEVEVD